MKPAKSVLALLVMLAISSGAFAQPRFEVPLKITDGAYTYMLYFGILPEGHFCIDPSDTINGHIETYLPPPPLPGVYDARFICPRSSCGPSCFDQGSSSDFRRFTSTAQKDTFTPRAQMGEGMTVSWPSGLSAYSQN